MLNSCYHLEGYIIALKDSLKCLEQFINSKYEDCSEGIITIPEYRKTVQTVDELKPYFNNLIRDYKELLERERSKQVK